MCAILMQSAASSQVVFTGNTMTDLFLRATGIHLNTCVLVSIVKIGFFFFSCCNEQQSMYCIYLNIGQNLFWKTAPKKPCVLFMVGQIQRVNRLCQ